MISTIRFHSGYPTRLPGIGRRRIHLGNRLNVILGPNGSGKSTILGALAAATGCGGGGWSDGREPEPLPYSMTVERDDQPAFYQDCYRDSEESFVGAADLEAHAHLRSTGEKRIGLINELIDYIENRFLSYRMSRDERPCLLLDEVDNHIGFAGQAVLWGGLFPTLSKKYQLVVSTHSIFPLLLRRNNVLRRDNVIVLSPKYDEICIEELGRAIEYYNREGDGSAGEEG